jgi:hypothetical protein
MFTRTSSIFASAMMSGAMLLAAGCSAGKPDNSKLAEVEKKAAESADEDGRVLCALDGAEKYGRTCTMDRKTTQTGEEIVLSRGDGGFRRLRVLTNGRGVEVADGAEPAKLNVVEEGLLDVAIGSDRYRLPAATKTKAESKTAELAK